jgi:hypothetical protein
MCEKFIAGDVQASAVSLKPPTFLQVLSHHCVTDTGASLALVLTMQQQYENNCFP